MKFNPFTRVVVLVLLVALTGCKPIAPTTGTELQANVTKAVPATEFNSATNQFRLSYPAAWVAEEALAGGDLLLANSALALERYNSGSALDAGDLVLNVGFLPLTLLQEKDFAHLDFQLEASPEIVLQSLMPLFQIGDEPAGNVAGEVTLIALNHERDAGMLTVAAEGREGMIMTFMVGEGVLAFVSAVTVPGEMAQFQEITYAVAASVIYSGAQDALYGVLMGG